MITNEQFSDIQKITGIEFEYWEREFINGTLKKLPYLHNVNLTPLYNVKSLIEVDKEPIILDGNIYRNELIHLHALLKNVVPVRNMMFKGELYD